MDHITHSESLEEALSEPYREDVQAVEGLEGDLLVLGAGGKMGPSLVTRAVRAIRTAGTASRVFAVSRFSDSALADRLATEGAIPIPCDLLEAGELKSLPDCGNIISMVGSKFGTVGAESFTWATNAYLPGLIARRFRKARIVALSTGNVYPLVPVESGGSTEADPVGPIGEYAQSCLGRERIFQYFSGLHSTPVCLIRLNYAVEARYGVLLDIAGKVFQGIPVSLDMGYLNVIWQGDANSVCLRALSLCSTPPCILNLTGSGTLSVRQLALEFGRRFGVEVAFAGHEAPTALLNNAARCHQLFGPPRVSVPELIGLVARWVESGGPTLNKPTKFEVRNGKF